MCKYIFKEEGFPDWRYDRMKNARTEKLKTARQICMYFGHIYFNGVTLKQLAEPFNRDHATAIHSIKVVRNRAEVEKDFKRKIDEYKITIDRLFDESIILMRVSKEKELAGMLLAKIKDMELIARVYCVLSDKKMVDL